MNLSEMCPVRTPVEKYPPTPLPILTKVLIADGLASGKSKLNR